MRDERRPAQTLVELIAQRAAFLTEYQNKDYADRYRSFVTDVLNWESARVPSRALTEAGARSLFKLMAYKDEYEVARLYTSGAFLQKLNAQFEGDFKLSFHLAPPLLARRDPQTGELIKQSYGPWVFHAFKLLARLRHLRGTRLDIFGHTAERKQERQLIVDYEKLIGGVLAELTPDNHATAVELAQLPDQIRGFGHVKERNIAKAKAREAELLKTFRDAMPMRAAV
jgi:indolepyruvate ferredoxin oxidoreductase